MPVLCAGRTVPGMILRGYLLALCFVLLALAWSAEARPRWRSQSEVPPVPVPEVSGMAPVNGISMYYAIYGQGTPVLLIHGGLGSSDVWAAEIPLLAKHHEVIVADSRGQGRSTTNSERLTYTLMADDYLALLDYLKVRQVALVGWSDGGIIGLDIAIHHPDRLSALFAQAANASPDGLIAMSPVEKQDFLSRVHRLIGQAKGHVVSVVRAAGSRVLAIFGRSASAAPPSPSLALQKEILKLWVTEPHYSEEELASIRVRTAIVIGDHDDVIRLDHTKYLARTIPGAQFIILHGVGHSAVVEDPVGYSHAVRAFLDGSASSPR